ncbi:hypothetical protein Scep_016917 [Stephania cephalantha]|uniref:Uncharacterized protein n=1 Tax=Stephania cephalantha TaxID=152367 RepID=A0AAP0NUL4_9MAGN
MTVSTLLTPIAFDNRQIISGLFGEGVKWVINMDKYRKIKFCCLQSKAAEPYLEYCGVT